MKTPKRYKSFSVIEVVVVCAVVAILASLIMSASSSVREAGKKTTCLNNLKQIQAVYEAYRKDHRKAPAGDIENHDDFSFAKAYVTVSDLDTFVCPGDKNVELTSLDHLDGHTSYTYKPSDATGYNDGVSGQYEVAGKDKVDVASLKLVIFDNNDGNHNGYRNIVYLHGSGNSKSGIAQTIKVGEIVKEHVVADNASPVKEEAVDAPVEEAVVPTEEKTFVDDSSSFDDYVNSVNTDTAMTLDEYLANATKGEIKKWEDVIYTESTGDAFEDGYDYEIIEGTEVVGKSTEPQVTAIYATDGIKVSALSEELLTNVVLEFADGSIQKFENINNTQVTVWGTGENADKLVANVWIKSGDNGSGDGPDFGEYLKLAVTGNNGWGNGDQTATGNSLENNNAENDTDGQTHQIHGEANPN